MNAMIARMAKESRPNMMKCHLKWQQHPAHGLFGRTTNTFKSSRRWLLRRTGGLYHQYPPTPQFLQRCFAKREQAASYQYQRETASWILLPVDCTCQTQDEIQRAQWKQSQVSVFSAAFWQSETLHSQVIASDNSVHYKETLITYLDLILLSKPATLKALSIWSDGARSQFKHKYTLAAIAVLESKHDSKITWNFLATSHGKGPVDGIGAAKHNVWNMVKTPQNQVTNVTSFTTASETMPNVEVIEMILEMINNTNKALGLDDVFKNAVILQSIANVHCVYMYVSMYVCMYVYINMYVCMCI